MKRLLILSFVILTLVSCGGNKNQGELVGVRKQSKPFYRPDPYGMVFIPMGSFTMGAGGQDIASSQMMQPKTVTISPFFMDETEITNNEYREFVTWVRDSIARKILSEGDNGDAYLITENPKTGEEYDVPILNWEEKIDWNDELLVEELFLPEGERFYDRKEIDTRKLFYEYYWIDLQSAAKKEFRDDADYRNASFANRPQGFQDRSVYIKRDIINVYPDTLAWIHDYSYSLNDPLHEKYFWHVAYDHYPVVGVNWTQAKAFCLWRTEKENKYLSKQRGNALLSEYRLPTEAEWEYAARAGNNYSTYPWEGSYTRNDKGCFLANFKPLRGNYIADGYLTTSIVAHYEANDWGLYDMAGNVAEWTSTAYDPSSYNYTWDINPNYVYNAKPTDPAILKRKVVRGGSWKDVAYYMEVSTRTYEYQDTAKCYIGFRCVQPYLERKQVEDLKNESKVY